MHVYKAGGREFQILRPATLKLRVPTSEVGTKGAESRQPEGASGIMSMRGRK